MKVVYALEDVSLITQPTIFLAGPTYREPGRRSWRADALELLKKHEFKGQVLVPEPRNVMEIGGEWGPDQYEDQINWEHACLLSVSQVVMFWIPRDLQTLPGFTTNIEFGILWGRIDDNKANHVEMVVGFPPDAPATKYIDNLCRRRCITLNYSLEATVQAAVRVYAPVSTVAFNS